MGQRLRNAADSGGASNKTRSALSERSAHATSHVPHLHTVLGVVAHPDDETFGLGGVLAAFVGFGMVVHVVVLTHGERSTVGRSPDLGARRVRELTTAGMELGLASVEAHDLGDGRLARVDRARLVGIIGEAVSRTGADGLITFDPSGVTGHPDHVAAAEATISAGRRTERPVLGWTVPVRVARCLNREFDMAFTGRTEFEIDFVLPVDRDRQRRAAAAHASQAASLDVVERRWELSGDVAWLSWLYRPGSMSAESDWR